MESGWRAPKPRMRVGEWRTMVWLAMLRLQHSRGGVRSGVRRATVQGQASSKGAEARGGRRTHARREAEEMPSADSSTRHHGARGGCNRGKGEEGSGCDVLSWPSFDVNGHACDFAVSPPQQKSAVLASPCTTGAPHRAAGYLGLAPQGHRPAVEYLDSRAAPWPGRLAMLCGRSWPMRRPGASDGLV